MYGIEETANLNTIQAFVYSCYWDFRTSTSRIALNTSSVQDRTHGRLLLQR